MDLVHLEQSPCCLQVEALDLWIIEISSTPSGAVANCKSSLCQFAGPKCGSFRPWSIQGRSPAKDAACALCLVLYDGFLLSSENDPGRTDFGPIKKVSPRECSQCRGMEYGRPTRITGQDFFLATRVGRRVSAIQKPSACNSFFRRTPETSVFARGAPYHSNWGPGADFIWPWHG